jgi:CTP synthase
MENELYLEAVRQLRQEVGEANVLIVLLTYIPIPAGVEEQKSKPTQQSVKLLNERGIRPDVIVGRCAERLTDKIKQKIALFCNIDKTAVISGLDVPSVYQIPLIFEEEGLTEIVHKRLTIYSPPQLMEWRMLVDRLLNPTGRWFAWPSAGSTPICMIPTRA